MFKGRKITYGRTLISSPKFSIEVDRAQEGLQCLTFENGLLSDHSFRSKLGKRKVKYIQEMLTMAEPFLLLEEKLTIHFNNPTSSEPHSGRPYGKKSHWRWDDSNKNMQGKFDRYTFLTISHKRIYQECVSTKFRMTSISRKGDLLNIKIQIVPIPKNSQP